MKKWIGIGLFLFLAIPPVAKFMETYMVIHMLVQIPALIVAGFLIGTDLRNNWPKRLMGFNDGGVAGVLLAIFVIMYWSLPRALDATLMYPTFEVLKFMSNTFLVGVPLALSWHKFHPIGKAFVWTNVISMVFVMSWLYIAAPIQLCNSYLENQQVIVGKVFFWIGIALCFYFVAVLMVGSPQKQEKLINTTAEG